MISADILVSNCSQLLTCKGPIPKRKKDVEDVGAIENGCIASLNGKIVFVGRGDQYRTKVHLEKGGNRIDGTGLTAIPGLIDAHTHLPFAGNRVEEFVLRLKGATYQELARKGMGIQTTVQATRKASRDEIVSLSLKRLNRMLLHGTTTAEAKSGYGLNFEDEVKQLEALREVSRKHPVQIVPTFMGAHEVPPEYRDRKRGYIDFLIHHAIPAIKAKDLAEFFDVFCEEGVFSIEESRTLIRAAKKAGLKIRVHADEFTSLGGAQLAAEEGAVSADHLIAISDEGIERLSQSSTVAILLPAVSFFLRLEKKAPARELIDRGAIVALATDFNPGSSMASSLLFILQLAVFTLRMSMEEALNAVTANAAFALSREKEIGSLEVGKMMDLVLCDVPDYPSLFYNIGINSVRHVIKKGKLVVKHGKILQEKKH